MGRERGEWRGEERNMKEREMERRREKYDGEGEGGVVRWGREGIEGQEELWSYCRVGWWRGGGMGTH